MSKNKTPLREWLYGTDANGKQNVSDINRFLKDNYIPKKVSLDFKDFELFFNKRKDLLREKIRDQIIRG